MLKVIVTATLLVYYVNAVVTEKKDDTSKSNKEDVNRREAPIDSGLPPDSYNPPPDSTAFIGPKPIYGPPNFPSPPPDNYGPPPPPPVPELPSDNYGPPIKQPLPPIGYGPPPSGLFDSHGPLLAPPQLSSSYGLPQSFSVSNNFGAFPSHPLPLDNYGPPPPPSPPLPPTKLKPIYGVPFLKPKPVYGPPIALPRPDVYGPPPLLSPPPRPGQKLKPIYGPPKPVYGTPNINYGPPPPSLPKPKPIYGPPKPPLKVPPKPLYGPPLKPPSIQSPKPFYGPPPKPVYGPPVKPSFISPPVPPPSYGPPPESHGLPILGSHAGASIQGNTNTLLGSSYGPPPSIPHGSPPSIPHGPPITTINSFEESPRPPPGVPAPPTPPDITYDGWQPMPGLTSHPHDHSITLPTEGHNINLQGYDYGGSPPPPPLLTQHAPPVESAQISLQNVAGHSDVSALDVSGQSGSGQSNSLSESCCDLPLQITGIHNSGGSVQSDFGHIGHSPSSSYGTPESGLLGSHITSDINLGSVTTHSNSLNSPPSAVDASAVSNSFELLPPQGAYRQLQDSYGPPPSGPSTSLSYGVPPPQPSPSHTPPSNPSDSYGPPPPINNIPPNLSSDFYGGPPPPLPLPLHNETFAGQSHPFALPSLVPDSHVPSTSYEIPPLGSYIPPITGLGGDTGPFAEPSGGVHIGSNLPSVYGIPLKTPIGTFGVPISGCCGTPPPNISPPKDIIPQTYFPPSISSVNNPGLSYGVPSGKQVEGPNIQPKVPVKFREPVPKGLLESIAQSAQYKYSGHGVPFQGQTYIPPSVPEVSKPVKENNFDNHVDVENHGVSDVNGAFQITPSLSYDLSAPSDNEGLVTGSALYGIPNTPSAIISLPSETQSAVIKSVDLSNNYPPSQLSHDNTQTNDKDHVIHDGRSVDEHSDLHSQYTDTAVNHQGTNLINNVAHSHETEEINSFIQSLGLQGQTITSSQALDHSSIADHSTSTNVVKEDNSGSYVQHSSLGGLQNIPTQGALGSYTLQIQPASGVSGDGSSDNSISHDEILSNGLLQDILAAIEQQPINNGHHQTNFIAGDPLHTSASFSIPQYTPSKNSISHGAGKSEEIVASSSESVIQLDQKSNLEGHPTQLPVPANDQESFSSVLSKSGIALYFNSEHGRNRNVTSSEDSSLERQIKLLDESSADKASYVLFKSPDVNYVYGEMSSSSSSVPTSQNKDSKSSVS